MERENTTKTQEKVNEAISKAKSKTSQAKETAKKATSKTQSTAASAKRKVDEFRKSPRVEEIKVKGKNLVGKTKDLVKEGNVRSLTIKSKEGKTLLNVPLTIGLAGIVLAPTLSAVAVIASLVTECSIVVERRS